MPEAILAVLILAPLAMTFLLKSNAALGFLTLCGSFVLITFASADIKNLTHNLSLQLNASDLNLIILVLPLLITLVLSHRNFKGNVLLILQLIDALCLGALLALVAIPLLDSSARANFSHSQAWDTLQNIQTPVIAVGAVLSFILVWAGGFKHPKKHK